MAHRPPRPQILIFAGFLRFSRAWRGRVPANMKGVWEVTSMAWGHQDCHQIAFKLMHQIGDGKPGSRWAGNKSARRFNIGTFGQIIIAFSSCHGRIQRQMQKMQCQYKRFQGRCVKTQISPEMFISWCCLLGLPIIWIWGSQGPFGLYIVKKCTTKTLYNYSASLWTSNFSISFWENRK